MSVEEAPSNSIEKLSADENHDEVKQQLAIDPEINKNSDGLPTPTPEENPASNNMEQSSSSEPAPIDSPKDNDIPENGSVQPNEQNTVVQKEGGENSVEVAPAQTEQSADSEKRERDSEENEISPAAKKPKIEDSSVESNKEEAAAVEIKENGTEPVQNGADSEIKEKVLVSTNDESTTKNGEEEADTSVIPVPTEPAPKPPSEPDMNNLPENPMPKHQAKHALTTIKAVRRLKDAAPFLVPVDTVKNNIPFYYNYIPRPMDLSTIERKINVNAYETHQQLTDDFNLMVNNCAKFNGKDSAIAQMARNIQANFEKHMLNMPPKDIVTGTVGLKGRRKTNTDVSGVPRIRRESAVNDGRPKREIHPPKSKDITYESKPRKKKFIPELRFCSQVLKELLSKKHESISYPFIAPVDPVALGCPTYFDIIKHPMDLGTIQTKLSNNEYENADEFEADVRLVFQNAYAFNPPSTPVNMMGHRLEEIFDKKWVDRPATPPSPQNMSEYESESDDELEEIKIDQSVLTNPAIEYLEQQIERMRKDLDEMKQKLYEKIKAERMAKKKTKKSSKRGGAGNKKKKPRRGSVHNNGYINGPITFDMKQELSSKLADLPEEDTEGVVQIIQSMKNPPAPVNEDGEMELELDALDNETITKLYNYVFKKKKRSGPGRPSSGIMKNRREKKLITEDEQNNRIESLKKQLEKFEGDGNGNGAGSSSDDDESEESSEEE